MNELQEQLVEELRDLLDAEKQLTKAMPKIAKVVTTEELKQAFLLHLEQTKTQVTRLEKVFELLGQKAKSKPCKAMQGLIEESQEHIQESERGELLDNMLITAAQKVEHYEIAGYGTVVTIAKNLGLREVAGLLQETLKEEGATDKILTACSLQIQKQLMRKPSKEEGEEEAPKSKKKVAAAKKSAGKSAGKSDESDSGSLVSTDHEEIRQWAEERQAKPACVRGTGKKGDLGILRLDFPGYSGGNQLEEISWDEFFEKFDEQGLALLHQNQTAAGEMSNFNKLVSRGAGEGSSKKGKSKKR